MSPNPQFRFTVKRDDYFTVSVYMILFGNSPFTAGANRFIGTGAIVLAYAALNGPQPDPIITFNPLLPLKAVIDPLEQTQQTANAGEYYNSVNIEALPNVNQMVIPSAQEFLLFKAKYPTGVPKGFKLLNVNYRHDINTNRAHGGTPVNDQGQTVIQGNFGEEYTAPFQNPSEIFYSTEGQSQAGWAGAGNGGDMGYDPNDFNSFAELIAP